ncbi:helix-turn-helix domain-containing protein [Rhizobium lemnae]|uniref:Helix-turn-helix domain-containing protein n=1 Tax=Rhizobium lemnae TaxID=1214924 RepID=A0ABV8EA35_9HYPH|nr:helix-turn-helix transcriptional regulator [Rhizobium lemnae]MCJ8506901.1 helix-turn-helix domain-containing protein [Rhizobium lemnae]
MRFSSITGYGNEPEQNTIGGRISIARETLELSLNKAAGTVDVSQTVWSNWERDRCEPPPQMLVRIAETLQVTLYWLLTGRGVGPCWRDLIEISPSTLECCWQAMEPSPLAEIFFPSSRLTAPR